MLALESKVKVSIVTVCYNSENTIKRTIESVLEQTYPNLEYIIIDGASKDRSMDIINEYRDQFHGRMRVVSEPDRGIYDAMNKGIDMATGELIGIINSDDYYEADAVENIIAKYNKEKFAVLYGMVRIIQGGLEKEVVLLSHNFLHERMIAHPGCFVTKDVYEQITKYNPHHVSAADYEFMLRIANVDGVAFIPVYSIISNYNIGGISSQPRGLLDALRVKREYKIISSVVYWKNFGKIKWNELLGRLSK